MKVTITGATGFVGRHLSELLVRQGAEVFGLSNDSCPMSESLKQRHLDITDECELAKTFQDSCPAQVFHLAAISSLTEASQKERLAFDVNVWGTRNVLHASSLLATPPRVLSVSSSQVYGNARDTQLGEDSPLRPANVYATTKAMAEMCARLYTDRVEVIIARSFNHTGPGQNDTFVLPYLAARIAEIEAGLIAPIIRIGDLNVERDFSDVRDVVRAYALLMRHGRRGNVYNVCSGRYHRISDLLAYLLSLADCKIAVEVDGSRFRSDDPRRIWGNHAKLAEHTGWLPEIPIEKTLEDMLAYWRSSISQGALELGGSCA